jgi:hypothetical protein
LRDRADETETLGVIGAECSHSFYGWVVSGFGSGVLIRFPKKCWSEVVSLPVMQVHQINLTSAHLTPGLE